MITFIDNYDSFTYNLVQYFGELGEMVRVYRNDEVSAQHVIDEKPSGIVLSPGPCDPDQAGICLDIVKLASAADIPLFGVCLGHQAIVQAFGGTILRADNPMHGKVSDITHKGGVLFKDIPSPYPITRYHSLIAEQDSLPECLEVTAQTTDGIIMAVSHREKPIHGVQFHPESIATEHGHALLKNFIEQIK